MNFYNLADSVHATASPVLETVFLNGPVTSESCTQGCEEMPMSPSTGQGCETSESCTQGCEEMPVAPTASIDCPGTSESCTQGCGEMAMSPITGYVCDIGTSASCTEACGRETTSANKNFAAPPQFQTTSSSYQAAPEFLC
ncbi:hypothetical protein [Undibacterium flavidum]|uniref:Uncharacterized protein n=1 Tax=Undibacterium flavidum TaxID=2762297 RepID=A0ABR6Y6W6_9BURK|nr:hypothetical protein [Undibacterium flavidum]MBC3872354.1 hypothetical protein [Undibacterium flavidum]